MRFIINTCFILVGFLFGAEKGYANFCGTLDDGVYSTEFEGKPYEAVIKFYSASCKRSEPLFLYFRFGIIFKPPLPFYSRIDDLGIKHGWSAKFK